MTDTVIVHQPLATPPQRRKPMKPDEITELIRRLNGWDYYTSWGEKTSVTEEAAHVIDELADALAAERARAEKAEAEVEALRHDIKRHIAIAGAEAERAEKAEAALMLDPIKEMTTQPTKEIPMAERPVLVTTEYRGVFFGYAEDTSGDNITLNRARNCIYWPATQGGFAGLASEGPAKGSRIGSRVERMDLRKITSVTEVTPVAVEAWEAAEVYRGK